MQLLEKKAGQKDPYQSNMEALALRSATDLSLLCFVSSSHAWLQGHRQQFASSS